MCLTIEAGSRGEKFTKNLVGGQKRGRLRETNELFLMGLLSVIEALLNVPMKEVLSEIPVDEVIKNVLLGLPSRFRPIFDVVLDYESGTWKHLEHSAGAIGAAQKLSAGFVSSIAEMGE